MTLAQDFEFGGAHFFVSPLLQKLDMLRPAYGSWPPAVRGEVRWNSRSELPRASNHSGRTKKTFVFNIKNLTILRPAYGSRLTYVRCLTTNGRGMPLFLNTIRNATFSISRSTHTEKRSITNQTGRGPFPRMIRARHA